MKTRDRKIWLVRLAVGIVGLMAVAVQGADARMHQVVDGVEVYFGIVPAQLVRGHPKEHPEGEMHGGVSAGENHIMVALFERASGQRITDAEVTAAVSGKGMKRLRKRLEPMTVAGAQTYGNYFAMPGAGPYRIEVEIRRPGAARALRASFTWARS
jgi:hypothetical protein